MSNFGSHRHYRYFIVTNSVSGSTSLSCLVPVLGTVATIPRWNTDTVSSNLPAYLNRLSVINHYGIDNVSITASTSLVAFESVVGDYSDFSVIWNVSGVNVWGAIEFPEDIYIPLWYMHFSSSTFKPVTASIQYSDNGVDWVTTRTVANTETDNNNKLIAVGDYSIGKQCIFMHALNRFKSFNKTIKSKHSLVTNTFNKNVSATHKLLGMIKSDAVATLHNVRWRLSGGSSNTDTSLSLGGAPSDTEVLNQEIIPKGSIPGVTVLGGGGNQQGFGVLKLEIFNNIKYLTWVSSGEVYGGSSPITSDGVFTVMGGRGTYNGYLNVYIDYDLLPDYNSNMQVYVTNYIANLFSNLSNTDTLSGVTKYRCVYLHNNHNNAIMYDVKLFLKFVSHPDFDTYVGLDPNGVGGNASTVVDEDTAPASVVFSQPTVDNPLSIGVLAYDRSFPIWIKQISNNTIVSSLKHNLTGVGVSMRFYP